jgi:Zn-dependent protease with chaperone function
MFLVASLVLAHELTHIELQDLVRSLRLVQLKFFGLEM